MRVRTHHIIVAAGSGSRYGAATPKQFLPLEGGRPVLMTTLQPFMSRQDEHTVVVLSEDMTDYWLGLCDRYGFTSPEIVVGGNTRHQSVANAIKSIGRLHEGDIITVHDGARPLVTDAVINRVLSPIVARDAVAVIPVVDVTDSLRVDTPDGESITQAVDRRLYHAVQTPQAFDAVALRDAFSLAETPQMTDEAAVMEMAGHQIICVPGDSRNIKITRPGDIEIARLYLAER